MKKVVKFISLFAGIGGLDLGLERTGMECVAQVEIDEFCQKVLNKHWPNVPKFKDVRDVGKHNLPTAELICGGFPCQDVSVAGDRLGLEGERSTLWSEFFRIVCEVRPGWVVIENVTGLLSSDDGGFFRKILRELSEVGYDAEWRTISACEFGLFHLRERVFVVAYSRADSRPGLFGRDCQETGARNKIKAEWRKDWRFVELVSTAAELLFCWQKELGQSPLVRVVDGIPHLLDRIRANGNAVVPQCAEFIGHCILNAIR